MNFTAGRENERLIKNDNQKDEEFYQFLLAAFKNIYHALADGGGLYMFSMLILKDLILEMQ